MLTFLYNRGFGFIRYQREKDQLAAVHDCKKYGMRLADRDCRVDAASSEPKLKGQHDARGGRGNFDFIDRRGEGRRGEDGRDEDRRNENIGVGRGYDRRDARRDDRRDDRKHESKDDRGADRRDESTKYGRDIRSDDRRGQRKNYRSRSRDHQKNVSRSERDYSRQSPRR